VGITSFPIVIILALCLSTGAAIVLRAALRRSRRNTSLITDLEDTFDSLKHGVCLWDKNLTLIFCNASYVSMKRTTREFMKPGLKYRDLLQKSIDGGDYSGDPEHYIETTISRVTSKEGSSQIIVFENGTVIELVTRPVGANYLVTLEDITTRHRFQENIRERAKLVDLATKKFREKYETTIDTIEASVDALNSSAGALFVSSEQTSNRATSAAQASQRASDNVSSVSSAAGQLKISIDDICDRVSRSMASVNQAATEAERTSTNVAELDTAIRKVNDIADLIRSIAAQTNLLALNATIEASRAGEMGRGFEIVAAEVKALARETSNATDDISKRVGSIQTSATATSKAMQALLLKIVEVGQFAANVASATEEQTFATAEISRSVESASAETRHVGIVLQEAAASAVTTQNVAQEVRKITENVQASIQNFNADVSAFMEQIAV